jgi:hypothetical protein
MRALLAITAGGSALPSWLSFNPSTRTFSGTPTSTDVGTISVRGTANDLGSLAASETFNITVSTTPNGAPTAPRKRADDSRVFASVAADRGTVRRLPLPAGNDGPSSVLWCQCGPISAAGRCPRRFGSIDKA